MTMWNAMGSTIHSATHSAVMTVFLILTEFLFVMGIVLSKDKKRGYGTPFWKRSYPRGNVFTLF